MFIYTILNLLVAPGVIAHELAHSFSCLLGGVKIFKVKFFRFGNPAGYVEHAEPTGFVQSLAISSGPLIFNSLLALLLFSQFNFSFYEPLRFVAFWLGFVIALHAIPSKGDVKVLWNVFKKNIFKNPFVIIGFPVVILLYLLDLFKHWHIHVLYAIFLVLLGSIYLKI